MLGVVEFGTCVELPSVYSFLWFLIRRLVLILMYLCLLRGRSSSVSSGFGLMFVVHMIVCVGMRLFLVRMMEFCLIDSSVVVILILIFFFVNCFVV